MWKRHGHIFKMISSILFLMLRCYHFKSCIFWDLHPASAYFKMDWIMKAQAHFFTGKGQQTRSICITDTKAQATIKPVSKIISIFSLATICLAICLLCHLRKKRVKHRFTYTYMLVNIFSLRCCTFWGSWMTVFTS